MLRRAIADRYTERGIRTSPERILVTNGAQQALSLLARALLAPGERVLVEGPTYPGALEAFREQAAQPLSLPAGLGGLAAAARRHRIALAYVISTFHNPTGAVLSPFARRALVRAAAEAGVPLLDDEVLSDLGFPGVPAPPPLAAYADGVISVGSLSKSVWGGLRIGWVRAAEPLIARLARLLAVYDLGGNVPAQLAAAELLPQLDALCRGRPRCGRHATITCAPSWPGCCPAGKRRRCRAGRPCGSACRTVTGPRSPRQRCATGSRCCRATGSTRPGGAVTTCGMHFLAPAR